MGIFGTLLGRAAAPALAFLLCWCVVRRAALHFKLRHLGGPWWSGLTHWPHSKAIISPNCHEWYADINERYGMRNYLSAHSLTDDRISIDNAHHLLEANFLKGRVARIAPGILVTSSPEVWAHVNRHPGYKRSDWYYHACRIEYQRDNVFSQTDNEKHERRRKQMAPGV